MQKIQMVDLISQYRDISGAINDGFTRVLNSAAFINGPEVKTFEKNLAEYVGEGEVIPCANGTDALQIALMALGLQPGDEVIVPSFTYIASAEVIALLGLTPVPVEVNPNTFNLCPSSFRESISSKTKAVIPVHLFGQTCKMDVILKIAEEHHLFVIEDNAQSIGGSFIGKDGRKKKAGTLGHIGTTSFYPSKNLGCYGDGGAIFCSNAELVKKIRMIANHGQSERYYHDIIGVNSRLDSLQAVILNAKLDKLDDYISSRQLAAAKYDDALESIPEIQIPFRASHTDHVFHQYTIRVKGDRRNALKEYLGEKDIPSMIYYPVAIHAQKAFQYSITRVPNLSDTELICKEVLSLPIHTELGDDQIEHITDSIKSFFK